MIGWKLTNLIVGGTGFIGGHLAEYFFSEGEISKGIFRKGSHLRILDQCGIQCLEADLMDRNSLHEPLDAVDVVYFLASPPSGREVDYAGFSRNALANLLGECLDHGVKTFVYLSCLDVYGFGSGRTIGRDRAVGPTDEYQKSKLDGERIVSEFSRTHPEVQVRIVRAAKAVGSREASVVIPILKMMEGGKVILPGGGRNRLSLAHPKDVAKALLMAANYGGGSGPFQVKSFDASADELSRALASACGKVVEVKQQGMFNKGLIGKYAADEMAAGLVLEEDESAKKIGYIPVFDLMKVVEEVSAWYRKEPWATRSLA